MNQIQSIPCLHLDLDSVSRYDDPMQDFPPQGEGYEIALSKPSKGLRTAMPPLYVRIRYYGLHHSSARKEKLPRCRALLGLEPALPEPKELSLLDWLAEVLGEEQVDRCPHCGASASLLKRTEFERLPWL